MDNKLSKKLGFVLKTKIIKEMNLDLDEQKKWLTKKKKDVIEYCLKNNLLAPEKINELYNLYKNSSNAVLYLLESNASQFNYSLIDENFIMKKIKDVNIENHEERISNFSLESLDKYDNYIHISFTYTKQIDTIYGGYPAIKGYSVGDILSLKILEDASILHYFKYNRFVVKCNDWSAMKSIKSIIDKTFLCTVYHPKLTKELLDKITINPNGRSHIIKASYLNQEKKNTEPASISVSDNDLEGIDLFTDLEGDNKYSKVFNCFMVDINGTPRFVGISNNKGKLWIPASLDKTELEQFTLAILERVQKTLHQLKDNPVKYIGVFNNYKFDDNTNVNEILRQLAVRIVSGDNNNRFSDEFFYNIIRYGKKYFQIMLKPYYCEQDSIINDIECSACKSSSLLLTTDSGEIYVKCKNCSYKSELLSYLSKQVTICCEKKFEISSYSDALIIIPTKETTENLKKFLESINYRHFKVDFFCIVDGELKQIKQSESKNVLQLNYFGPFKKVLNTSSDKKADKELLKMHERCLRYNPKKQFCKDCSDGLLGKSLDAVDIGNNYLHEDNKIRICLPSLFGYGVGLKLDGIHNGFEKADIKFFYDENTTQIIQDDRKDTSGLKRIGIHVKAAVKNDPKDINNPKLTSALGHVITSKFKNDFDIIGIAIPNELNSEILNQLIFVSNGLGINLLLVDKSDWVKIYSYYIEQENF